jgi:hypothetical protein
MEGGRPGKVPGEKLLKQVRKPTQFYACVTPRGAKRSLAISMLNASMMDRLLPSILYKAKVNNPPSPSMHF